MIWIIAFIIVFILLIAAAATRIDSPTHEIDCEPPSLPHSPAPHWEPNHFIHKRQHRNDERHARHKRNQTPW